MLFFWFFKNCELIRDSSLWRSNFIPLVHDSIIIIGSRSVTYTFGSRFTYKRWVKVLSKNLNFSFLGQVFQYWLLGFKACQLRFASYSNIVCWVSMRVYWGSHQNLSKNQMKKFCSLKLDRCIYRELQKSDFQIRFLHISKLCV